MRTAIARVCQRVYYRDPLPTTEVLSHFVALGVISTRCCTIVLAGYAIQIVVFVYTHCSTLGSIYVFVLNILFWIQICVKYICSTFWSVFVSHLVELVGIDLESNELHSFWCSCHLCFASFPPCVLSRFSVHCFNARTYETKRLLMQRVFCFCVNA